MKSGDKIELTLKDEKILATYMPSSDPNYITIKLESGYNISIKKKEILSSKVIEIYKETKDPNKKNKPDKKDLLKLSILHTGGTISNKVDYRTGVILRFFPEEILEMFLNSKKLDMCLL